MHRFWDPIIRPLLEAVEPAVIVEIGAQAGRDTIHLLEYAQSSGPTVHVIEPEPEFDVEDFQRRFGDRFVMHEALSLNVLGRIAAPDVVLIDGDHNWFTVLHELKLLAKRSAKDKRPLPVILLHDTGWPYGRRDLYYNPETVPPAHRQPTRKAGLLPGSAELVESGGLNAHLHNAIYEHEIHSGVLTAVEDFLGESPEPATFLTFPGGHGLGILIPATRIDDRPAVADRVAWLQSTEFLTAHAEWIEEQRVREMIAGSELKRKLARTEADRGRLADELERQQRVLAERQGELQDSVRRRKQYQADTARLLEEVQALAGERDDAVQRTESLQRELVVRGNESTQLEARLTESESQRERLASELVEAEAERERLAVELAEVEGERERLTRRLAEAESARGHLSGELSESEGTRDRLTEELREARIRIDRLRERVTTKLKHAEAERDKVATALAGAEGDRERLTDELAEAGARHRGERDRLISELAAAVEAVEEATERETALRTELLGLRRALDEGAQRERQLAAELEKRSNRHQAVASALHRKIATARERDGRVREALATKQEKLRRYADALKATRAQAAELTEEASAAHLRQEAFEEDVRRLNAELVQSAEALSQSTASRLELEALATQREAERSRAAQAVTALATELEKSRTEVQLLVAERDELACNIEELRTTLTLHERDAAAHIHERELARGREQEVAVGLQTARAQLAASNAAVRRNEERARRVEEELAAQAAELHQSEEEDRGRESELLAALRATDARCVALRSSLDQAHAEIDRAAASRSWRFGHGVMTFFRLLTLRRGKGTNSLQRASERLAMAVIPESTGTPPAARPSAEISSTAYSAPVDDTEPIEGDSTEHVVADVVADVEHVNGGPPAAPQAPRGERRLVNLSDLGLDAGERREIVAAARVEADRLAADQLPDAVVRAGQIIRTFIKEVGPVWVERSQDRNDQFLRHLEQVAQDDAPQVMIGTLHSGENEFELCKASVARQRYPNLKHVVISGLPKKQSVATLMERFASSGFDLMIKLDGDMVLLDDDFVSRVVEIFQSDPDLELVQMAVLDFFSGEPMQGINAYRRSIEWRSERQDALFTDKTFVDKSKRLVTWAPFAHSAIHSPDPTPFQAFHFGVHRGVKVLQPLSATFNTDQGAEQTLYLEKTWEHFKVRRDPRLGFACLGFELALSGRYGLEHLDYSNPALDQAFEEFSGYSPAKLEAVVGAAREARVSSKPVRAVRADRRRILWRANTRVNSIVMPLPHFGIFGGVNRFFQLAQCFQNMGVEAVVAKPDNAWKFYEKKKFPQTREDFPTVPTVDFSEALSRSWDVVLSGDCTSGVMLTMPLFESRLTAAYLLNGWLHREANLRQIKLTEPDVVIANSSWAAGFYKDLAPVVVPGGIDLRQFSGSTEFPAQMPSAEAAWPHPHLRLVAYGGRRKPRKRFEDVIDACGILHGKGIPVELHVFDELPITEDVPFPLHYRGKLDHDGVAALMREVDVMVVAEQDAGWSNPAAEAMASGVPVVCTPAGTSDFAIDEESALVVPIAAPEQIATAVERLWNDPALAFDLRREGFSRIAQFDWPVVAAGLLDVFNDVRRDGSRRQALNARARKKIDGLNVKTLA
jgi:hypothetical protein